MSAIPLPIAPEKVTALTDRILCTRFRGQMAARVCLQRQDAKRQMRGRGKDDPAPQYDPCGIPGKCPVGVVIGKRLQGVEVPASADVDVPAQMRAARKATREREALHPSAEPTTEREERRPVVPEEEPGEEPVDLPAPVVTAKPRPAPEPAGATAAMIAATAELNRVPIEREPAPAPKPALKPEPMPAAKPTPVAAPKPSALAQTAPRTCSKCSGSLRSDNHSGVCARCRHHAPPPPAPRKCPECGAPLRSDNQTGRCAKCVNASGTHRRKAATTSIAAPVRACRNCPTPLRSDNKSGLCTKCQRLQPHPHPDCRTPEQRQGFRCERCRAPITASPHGGHDPRFCAACKQPRQNELQRAARAQKRNEPVQVNGPAAAPVVIPASAPAPSPYRPPGNTWLRAATVAELREHVTAIANELGRRQVAELFTGAIA